MKYETCIRGKDRTLVGRPVFKTGGGRQTSLVGSIPTLFRHFPSSARVSRQMAVRHTY